MTTNITKLIPILHVVDPSSERDFYERLGLRTTYEGSEYPDFIAVGNDTIEFGLSKRPDADPRSAGFTWQLGVVDIDAAIVAIEEVGIPFEVVVERPREDWTYRTVKIRTPNGFEVILEEQSE
jgi:catechol-2,3-dioxygenase